MSIVSADFYTRPTLEIAQRLLGKVLAYETPTGRITGRIVETEAYLHDDPASHSFRGPTMRTEAMFGPPGTAYIYLIYGIHYCFNVVTAAKGVGEAVLIRALEPLEGLELMEERRGTSDKRALCSGPAKLVQAFGFGPELNGHSLLAPPLCIEDDTHQGEIFTTTRIGIMKAADLPYRFYLKGNSFISRK